MSITALHCPNCGASLFPNCSRCAYCGGGLEVTGTFTSGDNNTAMGVSIATEIGWVYDPDKIAPGDVAKIGQPNTSIPVKLQPGDRIEDALRPLSSGITFFYPPMSPFIPQPPPLWERILQSMWIWI